MCNHFALLLLNAYRKLISPILPSACRFYPTCSEYAKDAFVRYSFFKAFFLTLCRLAKCHPFHPGGFDSLR